MSELDRNRSGALLPTTPKMEHQNWDHSSNSGLNGRRLLPSPGPKKVRFLKTRPNEFGSMTAR